MRLQVKQVGSSRAREAYVAVIAEDDSQPAIAMFQAAAKAAGSARLCRVRAFVPQHLLAQYGQAWDAFRAGRPAAPITWLHVGEGMPAAVQAHAIDATGDWCELDNGGAGSGVCLRNGPNCWAFLGGISGSGSDFAMTTEQAFTDARGLLAGAHLGLGDVGRTWFFLDKILTRYDDFNVGRSRLFKREGILLPGPNADSKVPASTGIGVSPAHGAALAMEAMAASGPDAGIVRLPAAGKQRSAYEYGSAFSRAAQMATPGGRTVLISGTAAIDAQGRTCFLDDGPGQIGMTIQNVLAVLQQCHCGGPDVVEAIAYCKTPQVAKEFAAHPSRPADWPWVVALGDVCRDDLLFEVEVTACQSVRH